MESAPLKRRLTAVLLADVVGYSRLMGRDEEDTHRRLAGFDSALAAVRCGLEIQRGLAAYNSDAAAEDPPIQLRIGINTGDVIVEERDIYGNSVNLAARLEGLAEPGAVYVSANVYDQLRGTPELA